jgi:multidrug efflux pump subunit AcrB
MCFLAFCAASCLLTPFLGQDFFPKVDAGQMRLHVRAKTGTRVEETAALCDHVEEVIRRIIPARELETLVDNIGLPTSGINNSYNNGGTVGPFDAEILISLNRENHHATAGYIRRLRHDLNLDFPGVSFFFQPADIVSQVLNFGLPSPIDIQVVGRNQAGNYQVANEIAGQLRQIPGAVDVHVQQMFDLPDLQVTTEDRALVLSQSGQRCELSSGVASAAVPSGFSAESGRHPGDGAERGGAAVAGQSGLDYPRHRTRGGEPLQCPACD